MEVSINAKMRLWLAAVYILYCQMVLAEAANITDDMSDPDTIQCKPGLLLPVWEPITNLALGDKIARGVVYFVCLVYTFVGVSIIADKFMAAIEVITSQEKLITIRKPNSEPQVISVRIWNETVSNLTLMALGSSAPEILLSIIEVYAQDFHAGELGPSTIVGSAAFNMFVIIAICVFCIPNNEYKRIKHLRVFFVTMVWSVFAYIWLCYILTWSSRGVIEIWEGLVTFMMFPATVLTAYIADRRLLIYKYLAPKKYRVNKRGVIVGTEGEDMELAQTKLNHVTDNGFKVFDETDDEAREFEEHRREYIQVLREIRKNNPNASMDEIEALARNEIMNRGPKSRAFYRLQATKKLTGGNNLAKRRVEKHEEVVKTSKKDDNTIKIFFNPGHYTVMENVGQFAVTVSRENYLNHSVCVDFKTEDGTANAGSDYEAVEGTLIFRSGEAHKQVFINVIDDDVFEEDEHFYVILSNPRYLSEDNVNGNMNNISKKLPKIQLSTPAVATVMILDDDHSGVFSFAEGHYEIAESSGEYELKVSRFSGARGRVIVPFKTTEGTAKDGSEFEMTSGHIVFDDNQTTQFIPIHIIDNESYEKDVIFYVELGEPIRDEDFDNESKDNSSQEHAMTSTDEIALLGRPKLGELYKCQVRIKESKEFKNMVDKLISKANTSIMVGSSCWKDQFVEAITVSAGDDDGDDGDDDGEEKVPSCSDYVMHFFTLFWKLLFAFVPPTDYFNGWLCFIFSIVVIGGLTAIIGDLASHFGCTSGIKDSVTAISFVALGTSVPDTFASKVAAQNDKYADSSIGNVTGSNAVNVFLGIGIAWTIAAVVNAYRGVPFEIDPGSLTYSVTIYCLSALVCCLVLMIRRRFGGELGGPTVYKVLTSMLFVSLWLFYLLMSCLESYGVIPGF